MGSDNSFIENIDNAEELLAEIRSANIESGIINFLKNKYDIDVHYIDFSFDYSGRLNVAAYMENTTELFKFTRLFFDDLGGIMGNVVKHGAVVDNISEMLYVNKIYVGEIWVLCYDYSMEYKGDCMVRLIKELLKLKFYKFWYTYDINDDRFYIVIEVEDKTKLQAAVDNAENLKKAVRNVLFQVDTEGRIEPNEIGFAVGCQNDIIGKDAMHCVNEETLEKCYKL